MEEVEDNTVENRVEVAKREISTFMKKCDFAKFIIALYSLSVYEFYDNWKFVFNRFVVNLPEFRFFVAIFNRLNETYRVFSSQVTPRISNRILRRFKTNILLHMVNGIISYTREKVHVDKYGYHEKKCNTNRQKVGNMCLRFILNQFAFRVRSISLETLDVSVYLFKRLMLNCFQNADVNPIFEHILETHPQLLTKMWCLKSSTLKRVFFPQIATLGEDIEVSKVLEISGVAALVYLDQHLPNQLSVSVTELLLQNRLIGRGTRDPHGFHVIFGPLFRTFNKRLFCLQRGQWRDQDDDNEGGLFLFGIYPFLNACPFGVVDEFILRDKLRLFMQYQIECFFVVTEKPSDPESKYFVLYNDSPEEDTVDESRMTMYLATHQICLYELIRVAEKSYFDDFFDPPDPNLTLLEDYVLREWDMKKRANLRIWRLFRTIRTHILFDRKFGHANFPAIRRMRYERPAPVSYENYFEEHYGGLSVKKRREKALSVLLAFFQMIFMNASLVDYRTNAVSIYRPWHPVGTVEDGGIIHDTESDEY